MISIMRKTNPLWALLLIPCSILQAQSEPNYRAKQEEEREIVSICNRSLNDLPNAEQQVYQQLGPLYQKIYLYALNDEERHRVVVYMTRGLTAYDAINTILRAEERQSISKQPKQPNKSIAPSDRRTQGSSCSKQEVF